jgi:hypothetical protein
MKSRRPRLTYANVVASIALFAALGGVSYAATSLPKNSVGTDQIQAEAVRTGKLAEDAVTASRLSQGVREQIAAASVTPTATPTPSSVKHAETADRAATADTATSADTAKVAGSATTAGTAASADTAKDAEALGGQPADHYLTADSVLQSGQTEAGDYIAAADNGQAGTVLVQFWPHLPESLQEGHIKVIPEGGGPTTECPGPGQAAPTYMCVYQSFNEGMMFESFISTMPGSIYAGPVSGVMTWRSNQSNGLLRGTWAYTAP